MTITNVFIIICIAVFIYIHFISKDDPQYTVLRIGGLYPRKVKEEHEWWRLIACNFIHENWLHLLMNMYCIYYLGNFFESLLGTGYYLGLILFGGIMSSLVTVAATMYFPRLENTITIGASGIFFAYLGAMIGLAMYQGGMFMSMLSSYAYMIVINLAFTFLTPGISKTGHLGGLFGGYIYTFILYLLGIIGR
jgi:rhomboid protease GluP